MDFSEIRVQYEVSEGDDTNVACVGSVDVDCEGRGKQGGVVDVDCYSVIYYYEVQTLHAEG